MIRRHLYSVGFFAISAALNLGLQILVLAIAGQGGFGTFATWRNNVHLFSALGRFGTAILSVKTVPETLLDKDQSKTAQFFVFALGLVTVGWLLFSVIYVFIVSPIYALEISHGLLITSTAALSVIALGSAWLRSADKIILGVAIERLFVLGLSFVGMLVMAAISSDVPAEYVMTIAFVVTALVVTILCARQFRMQLRAGIGSGRRLRTSAKEWTARSFGFFGVALGDSLTARATLFAAGFFLSASAIGELAILMMLAGLVSLTLMAVNQVSGPQMAKAAARQDRQGLLSHYRSSRYIALTIGLAATFVLLLAYPVLLPLVGVTLEVPLAIVALFFTAPILNTAFGAIALAVSLSGLQNLMAKIMLLTAVLKLVALIGLGISDGTTLFSIALVEILSTLFWNVWAFLALKRGEGTLKA